MNLLTDLAELNGAMALNSVNGFFSPRLDENERHNAINGEREGPGTPKASSTYRARVSLLLERHGDQAAIRLVQ